MKENISAIKRKINAVKQRTALTGKEIFYEVVIHIIFLTASFLCSRAAVFGKYIPFGISAAAASPMTYMPSAAMGCIIGYIFPVTGDGGFRYIAAVLTVVAIRLLTSKIKFTREKPIFCGFIAFLSSFFTGVSTLKGLSGGITFAIIEALLSGGVAYFLHSGSHSLIKCKSGLSTEQSASAVICISVVLTGLNTFTFGDLSVGRIVFIFFILLAARQAGAGTGAIFGVAAALSSASLGDSASVTVMLSFGGLMAGIFADMGKFAISCAFLSASLIGALTGSFTNESFVVVIEAIIGCGIYLMLPKTVLRRFSKYFARSVTVIRPEGLKKALTMRLNLAGNALKEVSETVENVSSQLSKINCPDFKKVLTKIEGDACKGCSMQIFCWETKYDQTLAAVMAMTKAVKNGESGVERFCDEEFKGRCLRCSRMGGAVYKHYSEYALAISAEKRIEEVRSVVTDQFLGIAQMLSSLSKEFEIDQKYDTAMASRIASTLKNLDIVADECGVKLDKEDHLTVDICIKNAKDIVLNRADIMKALCVACDRDFDPPLITFSSNNAYITASEHAYLTADIGVNQIGSKGNSICGDSYEYFFDGKGKLIIILSDGMGTGGRAAVDGAMASGLMCRLLKAGFDFDAALKILNSSMLFKSTDESLATLDIAEIDLFTGKTRLLKAGAAPTIIRRSGRAGKAQSTSLPAGILRGVSFDKAVITMKKGDIVLMMSDGAASEGTDWISAEIEGWDDGSAQALAERISKCARRRRTDKKEDDITVIAAILKTA